MIFLSTNGKFRKLMKLTVIESIPTRFFEIESNEILSVFPTPTLIHLKGNQAQQKKPLFISALLHGNETTSFYVIQKFLQDKKLNQLERDLIIFMGNVEAASKKQRMLEGQPDFNRIWDNDTSFAGAIAKEVIDYAKSHDVFASVDIHNNTGHNPYYACINRLDESFVSLASLFAPYIVYFTEPHEVQSMAFANFTPSVTLECGIPGVAEGIAYVTSYLNKIYELQDLKDINPNKSNLKVYQTQARLILKQGIELDYNYDCTSNSDISLRTDIDDFNFQELKPEESLGYTKDPQFIRVIDNHNQDITDVYLEFVNHEIKVKKTTFPAMLTTDGKIAIKDCLGYFMNTKPL